MLAVNLRVAGLCGYTKFLNVIPIEWRSVKRSWTADVIEINSDALRSTLVWQNYLPELDPIVFNFPQNFLQDQRY